MADLKSKLLELTRMKYADQAKWYLNGFWKDGAEQEAENIWRFAHKFIELDEKKKKEGNELDEFQAHKFLEYLGETLTVIQLREKLRTIDLDVNGKMALLEYLTFKFEKAIGDVVNAPQGDNQEEIEEASAKLQAVQDAYDEVQKQLQQQQEALAEQKHALQEQKKSSDAAKQALEESKKAEEDQKQALLEQKKAEDAVRSAEAEVKAAVDDLKSQEDSFTNQLKNLELKSNDSNAGTVSKSKAAAELAQLKQENPLPLRKAKITQEAALRKVEKERKAQEAATAIAEGKHAACVAAAQKAADAAAAAEEAQKEAEAKTVALEEQKARVEEAFRDTEARMKEAEEYLAEVKKKGGIAFGSIWWLERELKEAQKYLPKKKQT